MSEEAAFVRNGNAEKRKRSASTASPPEAHLTPPSKIPIHSRSLTFPFLTNQYPYSTCCTCTDRARLNRSALGPALRLSQKSDGSADNEKKESSDGVSGVFGSPELDRELDSSNDEFEFGPESHHSDHDMDSTPVPDSADDQIRTWLRKQFPSYATGGTEDQVMQDISFVTFFRF